MQNVLEKTAVIEVPVKKGFEPATYFKDRKGLWVGSTFEDTILPLAKPINTDFNFPLSSFNLLKNATDESIEKELPPEHLFSESNVCAIIASLISKQPAGEDGVLANTNYDCNLFYTPAFVVNVFWYLGVGAWRVGTWRRDDDAWGEGGRVFSPATSL